MFKKAAIILVIFTGLLGLVHMSRENVNTGAPPNGIAENEVPNLDPLAYLANWKRPEGPAKVGIQVGHWKNKEVPEELENLKANSGTQGGGSTEVEVNFAIAEQVATALEEKGIEVDILPTTIPPEYFADVFIAIHADGSTDRLKSGYKFAAPWRDMSGRADDLVAILEEEYETKTGLEKDPNITRNMRGYYAFSWWRYEHAIHPMTTAVIAETGFLTNKSDQDLLIRNSDVASDAIANALVTYLENQKLL
jgi:hypothetical protein